MLPFGKLEESGAGTRRQVMSRLMAKYEAADCMVERRGEDRLAVLVPGWDAAILPFESLLPLQRWFWDRMSVTVDEDGSARYRMVYWSGAQPLLHFAIASAFAFEAWFGSRTGLSPRLFLAAFAMANLVPLALSLASFGLSLRSLSQGACRARACS
jgi:hypothetical protein